MFLKYVLICVHIRKIIRYSSVHLMRCKCVRGVNLENSSDYKDKQKIEIVTSPRAMPSTNFVSENFIVTNFVFYKNQYFYIFFSFNIFYVLACKS